MIDVSWIVPDVLAIGSHPEREGPLAEVLPLYREAGFGAIVSATESPLDLGAVLEAGLEYLHLPVADLAAPARAQFENFVSFVDARRGEGRATLVHCMYGMGRAPTFAASWLIAHGANAADAIARVKAARAQGCVESEAQVRALHDFAR